MEKSYFLKVPTFLIVFSLIIYILYNVSLDLDIDNMFRAKNINELRKTLDELTEEIDKLDEDKKAQLAHLDDVRNSINYTFDEMVKIRSNISALEVISGATDLRGPGITIRMTDNTTSDSLSVNEKIVHDMDVRIIISELNAAGAEAIAINGKRIVSTTEVICIGPVIRINGEVVAAPFIIKAIGDPELLLENVIISPDSYAYDMKENYGIDIMAIKSYDISIPKNKDNFEIKFAEIVQE
jgi:uncharacterized protein YlxW (UPF0749 family)